MALQQRQAIFLSLSLSLPPPVSICACLSCSLPVSRCFWSFVKEEHSSTHRLSSCKFASRSSLLARKCMLRDDIHLSHCQCVRLNGRSCPLQKFTGAVSASPPRPSSPGNLFLLLLFLFIFIAVLSHGISPMGNSYWFPWVLAVMLLHDTELFETLFLSIY